MSRIIDGCIIEFPTPDNMSVAVGISYIYQVQFPRYESFLYFTIRFPHKVLVTTPARGSLE